MNINDTVYVQLTAAGRKAVKDHEKKENEFLKSCGIKPSEYSILDDKKRYLCLQMHRIMYIFGPCCDRPGKPSVFVNNEIHLAVEWEGEPE